MSWAEIALIALVALIVIGPKELPVVIRKGKQLYHAIQSSLREVSNALEEAADDADLKQEMKQLNQEVKHIVDLEGNLRETYDLSDFIDKNTTNEPPQKPL